MVLGQLAFLTAKRFLEWKLTVTFLYPGGLTGRSGFLPVSGELLLLCLTLGLQCSSALALCLLWEGTRKVGLSPLPPLFGMKGSGESAGSAGRLHSGSGLQA